MNLEITSALKDRSHILTLKADGNDVSSLVVHDLEIWMQGVRIRMGGIGGVHTKSEERKKGYASRLLEHTVTYMTGLDQDVSMLLGIPDFYHRFGFAVCVPGTSIRVATRDAERTASGAAPCRTRPASQEDVPFIVELYTSANRFRPCAVVRDEQHLRPTGWGSWDLGRASPMVLESGEGKRIAYFACLDKQTEVTAIEAAAIDRAGLECILAELSRMAVERRCGEILAHAPVDDPFAVYLRRCGARTQTEWPRMDGGMLRILNQDSLLGRLEAPLAQRIRDSRYAASRVTLSLETELGSARLVFGPRGAEEVVAEVALSQHRLIQLITGYRTAADVLEDPEVRGQGHAQALLDVLFGRQTPYIWTNDKF